MMWLRTLTLACAVGYLAWAFASSPRAGAQTTQQELDKLQGTWNYDLGSITHENGKQSVLMPADKQKRVMIQGNKFSFRSGENIPWQWQATITLDPTANPKRITLTGTPWSKTSVLHGIYQLSPDGGSLTIQTGIDGAMAPRRFLELNKPAEGVDGKKWYLSR